jgi:hypothetical protein
VKRRWGIGEERREACLKCQAKIGNALDLKFGKGGEVGSVKLLVLEMGERGTTLA